MRSTILLLCAAATLGACSTSEPPDAGSPTGTAPRAKITGTATYRERMMLPPGAVLEVTLEDVSRADAPADVIARNQVELNSAPPYQFELPFDPGRVSNNHRYNLRARITAGGDLMFQSDAGYAVLGLGNVMHVDMVLRRASADTSKASVPAQQVKGMYSYMADAGWFVDCRSGVRLAVAQEGDNAALESAYSKDRSKAGVPMLATVEGRVEDRMPMEGPGPRPTLIVEKFISVEPDQGCSGPSSTAQLENTYWKLMAVGSTPVETVEGAREIHIVFNSQNLRVSGFTGCNRMTGGYRIEGEKMELSNVAGTMMACVGSGMETEQRVHAMLGKVAGWKITGETLQLRDANGTVIAMFESRYMK